MIPVVFFVYGDYCCSVSVKTLLPEGCESLARSEYIKGFDGDYVSEYHDEISSNLNEPA